MSCSSCQTPLMPTLVACVSCGTPVAVEEPQVVVEPVQDDAPLSPFAGLDDYRAGDMGRIWLWVLLALVACLPLGLLALSAARKVNVRLRSGDPAGALSAAASTRKLAIASVAVTVVAVVGWLMLTGGQMDGTFDAPPATGEFVPSPAPIGPVETAPVN